MFEHGTTQKLVYGFLLAFHSNYGRIFSRFDTIHERDRHPARQTSDDVRHRPRVCIHRTALRKNGGVFMDPVYVVESE